eukprot:CAMPEP_0202012598 /NCGR_PEP_ID=MMETSP0905-20130828/23796_1 /ASSEMBLY_ACC=CAM_ASM_000554 /TAXON_ID=420261 /ORGANISM="Thalassiosira antarctica, Strain CCMP982" /LENGTH=131 /DNA_ID=CAMNT_0048571887 /DNA_START=124 /DNA_END=515 /DNA_ORIENTATION=+
MADWGTQFDDNFWDNQDGGGDAGDYTEGNADAAIPTTTTAGARAAEEEEVVGTVNDEPRKKPGGGGSCPNCGSRAIEALGPTGSSVCTDCGIIVEENTIVSSVEFVEGAGGSSAMVGQFVGANSTRAYGTG